MTKKTVSAIVPVFNEEKTVGKVIRALLDSPLIGEIICVNDGSEDRSLSILKSFGKKIKLINFKKNQGKGAVQAAGIKAAKGELLFFCDADLINFTVEHVEAMLSPVLKGQAKAVFGIPVLNNFGKPINPRFLKNQVYLAGERVYPREKILPYVEKLARSRGAGASEVFLNTLFSKKEIKIVPLQGLIKPAKEQKWSTTTALKQYLLSAIGVLQEIGRIEINSPRDLKKLENLLQVDTFENLLLRVREIENKKVRRLLQRYFASYLGKYRSYFKKIKL